MRNYVVMVCLFVTLIMTHNSEAYKVAFITGGASGIGAATVELFIKNGIKVGFLDYDQQAGERLAAQFSDDEIIFIHGNVAKVDDIHCAFAITVEKFGHLDIIFANAGIHQSKTLLELTEGDWQTIVDINLKGVVFTVKEGLPYLIKNNGGSIILTGSDQCFIGKSSCAYGITKGGIAQFTKSTALQYGHFNVRINTICPATIKTPFADRAMQQWANKDFCGNVEKAWEVEAAQYPLQRCGTADEVASLVYFLASDSAAFITGSLYSIDGGITAG